MVAQIIISIVAVLLVLRSLRSTVKAKKGFVQLGMWVLFWAVVVTVFWWPDSTNQLASVLHVGRGADAVMYVGILVIVIALFKLYNKMEKVDQNFTLLVRKIAIIEGERKNKR